MNLGPPPPGGDQNKGPTLLAVNWTFTSIAIAVVGLKLYTRFRIIREPALDDFFTVLSVVLVTISTSLITGSVDSGLGRHDYYLTPQEQHYSMKLNLIANPFGIMSYSLPNVSVAIFLNRILTLDTCRKWIIYAVVIIENIVAAISAILSYVQCPPFNFFWGASSTAACVRPQVVAIYCEFASAYSAATDVFLAVVPIAAFWKLKMKLKTKIGISLLMGVTLGAAFCAVMKTTKLRGFENPEDMNYNSVDMLIWAQLESNVIIIAACVPSLRPFIVSISNSVCDRKHRHFRGRKGFFAFSSHDRTLGLKNDAFGIETIGTKRINRITLESRSDASLPPENCIKKHTEIAMAWENV